MSAITVDQQAALEKPVATEAYFVEMRFRTATVRVCNFNQTYTWDGYEWKGLGAVGGIGEIKATEKVEPNPVVLSLDIAQLEWLALAVGDVDEYRGRACRIYMCPLDDGYLLIDDPVLAWAGNMDVVSVSVGELDDSGNATGSISLRCEPAGKNLRRRNGDRVNAEQQKLKYPTDTGLDYLNDLLSNPQTWLTTRFQMR